MENIFTTINLEPKYVADVIPSALALHNMLIKSNRSTNINAVQQLADTVLEDGIITKGNFCEEFQSKVFFTLQNKQKEIFHW